MGLNEIDAVAWDCFDYTERTEGEAWAKAAEYSRSRT